MTIAATRIGIDDIHELPDRVLAITSYLGWIAPRCCDELVANDQQAVVTAGEKFLNQYGAFAGRSMEGFFDLLACLNIDRHAFALTAILWLDHDR